MKKHVIYIIILLFLITTLSSAQSNKEDKFTTINLQIKTIYSTELGFIIEYPAGGKVRQAYLPYEFFDKGLAVRTREDNTNLTPQMNIIYKNLEPLKVKIYMPGNAVGERYQFLEFMPKDIADKFKNTNKLEFVLSDEKK